MQNNHIKLKYQTVALLAASLLVGCNNRLADSEFFGTIGLSVEGCGTQIKGSLINNNATFESAYNAGFGVSAYYVKDNTVFAGMENKTATLTDITTQSGKKVWATADAPLWQNGTKLAIYAWAPAMSLSRTVPVVNASSQNMTFTYAVPASVSAQSDIMCGFYTGAQYTDDKCSNTALANLTFTHPLTSVRFMVQESTQGYTVNSISLNNLYASGTCIATSGAYVWNGEGSTSYTMIVDGGTYNNGDQLGEFFIVIPQTFNENSSISVAVTPDGGDQTTLTYNLDGTQWKAGYTTTYGIDLMRDVIVEISSVATWENDHVNTYINDAVDLSEPLGSANSYNVPMSDGFYKFPSVKGNSEESVGEVKSVRVLWETDNTESAVQTGTIIGNASYFDGYIYMLTNGETAGNALVAAYSGPDGTGDILWSWHIWKAAAPSETGSPIPEMDRYIGALSAEGTGLTYQWGRKDPFMGTGMTSTGSFNEVAQATTVAQSILTPTTAYNLQGQDWLATPNDNLWQGQKTIYDPCPAGYVVASSSRYPIPVNRAQKQQVRCQRIISYNYVFTLAEDGSEITYADAAESTKQIHLTSYRQMQGSSEKEPVSYSVLYSVDGGSNWSEFDGDISTLGATSNLKGLLSTGNVGFTDETAIDLTSGCRNNIVNNKFFWMNSNEVADNLDLSTILTSTGETVATTTANCYVVQKPGTYRFPCVYGNSIQAGTRTHAGYSTSEGNGKLTLFLNSEGNGISCPEIIADIQPAHPCAALLWQDAWEMNVIAGESVAQGLITEVGLEDAAGTLPYITFTTANKNNLVEGNAVIALFDDTDQDGVFDSNEDALWSWHIWVCKESTTIGRDVWRDGGSNTYFMPMNIGITNGLDCKYIEINPSVILRLVQDSSDEVIEFTVIRPDVSAPAYPSCTYYQWGRKEPFPAYVIRGSSAERKPTYDMQGNAVAFTTQDWNNADVIKNGIKHPLVFCTTENMDNAYYNLWSRDNEQYSDNKDEIRDADTVNVIKTVYDPCPSGYKMPDMWLLAGLKTQSQLQSITYDIYRGQYGFAFGEGGGIPDYRLFIPFLSAIGADGTYAGYINDRGYVWTATPAGPDDHPSNGTYGGRYILFIKGGTETWAPTHKLFLKSDYRNRGFSARPVQAFDHENHGGQY